MTALRVLAGKLLRYALTGGVAAVVDLGGFALLLRAPHMPLAAAASLSFSAAVVVNYLLTSHFVFASGRSVRGFALFVGAALIGLGVNVGVTVLAAQQVGLAPVLAKLVGIGTAFLLNFALNVGVVYRRKPG